VLPQLDLSENIAPARNSTNKSTFRGENTMTHKVSSQDPTLFPTREKPIAQEVPQRPGPVDRTLVSILKRPNHNYKSNPDTFYSSMKAPFSVPWKENERSKDLDKVGKGPGIKVPTTFQDVVVPIAPPPKSRKIPKKRINLPDLL